MRNRTPLPTLPIAELARLADRNPHLGRRSALTDAIDANARGELSDKELAALYQQHAPNNMRQAARRQRARAPASDDGCFAKVGSTVYRDRDLNNTAGRLVALLVQRAGGDGWTDQYVESLAAALAVTPRTVQRATARAVAREMIAVAHRAGRRQRNRYTLLPAALPPPFPSSSPPRGRRRSGDKSVAVEPMPTASLSPCPSPASGRGELDGAGRAAVASPGAAERPSERCSERTEADELPSRSRSAPSSPAPGARRAPLARVASAIKFRARAGPAPSSRAPP